MFDVDQIYPVAEGSAAQVYVVAALILGDVLPDTTGVIVGVPAEIVAVVSTVLPHELTSVALTVPEPLHEPFPSKLSVVELVAAVTAAALQIALLETLQLMTV